MKAIAAVDRMWGIGKDGKLLTHLPEDMKFFTAVTKGKVIVMGRKTLQSFPEAKPLKNRIHIVLTKDENICGDGLTVCRSVEEVLGRLKAYNSDDVYIIGGESIYKQFLSCCDTAYVTCMNRDFSADAHFVNLDEEEGWEKTETGEEKEYEGLRFAFCTYKNRRCCGRTPEPCQEKNKTGEMPEPRQKRAVTVSDQESKRKIMEDRR